MVSAFLCLKHAKTITLQALTDAVYIALSHIYSDAG